MNLSRRMFLKRGGIALVSAGATVVWGPSFLRQLVFAADSRPTGNSRKILVCIFQRGAVDGLSMVAPFGDREYYNVRKEIAIPAPSKQSKDPTALDLDGHFGLHPSLAPLLPFYKQGHLAVIHACGSPSATRSHFDAQDFMECGVVDNKSINSGWINRALLECPEDRAKITPFRAVSMTSTLPKCLHGDHEALAIPNIGTFGVGTSGAAKAPGSAAMANGFEGMYETALGDVLHGTGKEAFDAIDMLRKANPAQYKPQNNAQYPGGGLGKSLQQIAQLIKADVGVEVAFADIGGWDTHANQGGATGQLANRLNEFGRALAAFHEDLGDRMADVVVLTMSEFGRTVRQNGNRGTDHGHATSFLVLGGAVRGGKVYGQWPGLAREQLHEKRDLAVTTDYRMVLADIARSHLGARDLSKIFPNYKPDTKKFHQLIRS
jgi:uncharacterized protein (DUF1501 family)